MKYFKNFLISLFIFLAVSLKVSAQDNYCKINQNLFDCLNYPELVELSKSKDNNQCIKHKVDIILNNPIVDNSINQNPNPELRNNPEIGKYIRIASWNINKGLNFDEIKNIFINPNLFISGIKNQNSQIEKKVRIQIEILQHSDIIVLSEVDSGMPRTGYRRIIEDFAKALGYNYAYGIEFLEIDPTHLGLEDYKWSEERILLQKGIIASEVNSCLYRGLHGNAILSRFPLKNVRVLRLPQPYDWYNCEKKEPSSLEKIRCYAAKKLLKEDIFREIRIGGRVSLIADVTVPEFNIPITIVATHLENKVLPRYRNDQVKFILNNIKNLNTTVILAGDFNTSCYDTGPIKANSSFSANINIITNPLFEIINIFRRYSDPTVKNIPIILPNPEQALFETIKEAQFADCESFDFSGKTSNEKRKALSNSNERCFIGFKPTFVFKRSFGIAKYKLDWIFVKPCTDGSNPYIGRTLYELNYSQKNPPSDHAPITVDIPLQNTRNCNDQ